jgi:hypothetical protein
VAVLAKEGQAGGGRKPETLTVDIVHRDGRFGLSTNNRQRGAWRCGTVKFAVVRLRGVGIVSGVSQAAVVGLLRGDALLLSCNRGSLVFRGTC